MESCQDLKTPAEFYSEVAHYCYKKNSKWPSIRNLRRWRAALGLEADDEGFFYGSDIELMSYLADVVVTKPRQRLTLSAYEAKKRRDYAREERAQKGFQTDG